MKRQTTTIRGGAGLLLLSLCLALAAPPEAARAEEDNDPETVTLSRRTAAYDPDSHRRVLGYFPARATLEIKEDGPAGMVMVHFTSPSGKEVEALCRRSDLGLPASPRVLKMFKQVRATNRDDVWTELEGDPFDRTLVTDLGNKALAMEDLDWRHAHTDHFVVHYEHGIFARKVARMAEFFYNYIARDMEGLEDRANGRSHIYIFRKPERWELFLNTVATTSPEWSFSFVRGPEMYLQQAHNTRQSASILAHEMTHLIMNRFFPGAPPLWLNEGIAEWYEEFAYAEYKGIKKSRRSLFKIIENKYPFRTLFDSRTYPESGDDVSRFYQTSKFLVGFLRLEYPPEKFVGLIRDATTDTPSMDALRKHYGFSGYEALEEEFEKFTF